MSSRLMGFPSSFQSLGSFSATSFGASIFEAAAATEPNVVFLPLGRCVMTLLSALHSDSGTFHFLAAAVINICRAVAPALRRNVLESRIERLPPVPMGPHTRFRRRFCAVDANSYL